MPKKADVPKIATMPLGNKQTCDCLQENVISPIQPKTQPRKKAAVQNYDMGCGKEGISVCITMPLLSEKPLVGILGHILNSPEFHDQLLRG